MAAPTTDPEVQLAKRIDEQLRGIRSIIRYLIDALSEATYRASSAEKVSCEIEVLRWLADAAERGLSKPTAKKKLVILKAINKICFAQIETGVSEELARAITIQKNWRRTGRGTP